FFLLRLASFPPPEVPSLHERLARAAGAPSLDANLTRISQHFEHAPLQLANRALEIEVGKDHRSHHAAIEIGGDELRHAAGVDGLEQSLLDALTDDFRQQL